MITFEGNQVVSCCFALSFALVFCRQLITRLRDRKNGLRCSVLARECWCKQCTKTCPVHVLWKFFEQLHVGSSPFAEITGTYANQVLRACCVALNMKKANLFRCHDLRRGHSEDMRNAGATLKEILDAGQWRSPRFLEYLDVNALEKDVVLSAHRDESSDED